MILSGVCADVQKREFRMRKDSRHTRGPEQVKQKEKNKKTMSGLEFTKKKKKNKTWELR